MNNKEGIDIALQLPSGARFFKCALQVNPFVYLNTHGKTSLFNNEDDYNAAIISACISEQLDAIAVTDHYRVSSSEKLISAANTAGIKVFPGFEAVTKDGVHLLCLFNPGTPIDKLERVIGDCGIHEEHDGSPVGKYDVIEFLKESQKWGAICIAAHIASSGGLLRKLSGQSRIKAWRSPDLLACALPGPIDNAPDDLRPILQNKNPDYQRERPVAIINASDVVDPTDLKEKQGTSCFLKMSALSVEGLRQAFLDPGSRIRLHTDPEPEDHAELIALAWEGGFLDGAAVHFNPNLNVLIGGRGAGKSTVIESLRYVLGLEPVGEEALQAHQGIVRQVLRSGTKISLMLQSHHPTQQKYLIERTIPNPCVVREDSGRIANLLPENILPRIDVYGQHEISELTRSSEKLTRLLDRFVEPDESLHRRKNDLRRDLRKSRQSVLSLCSELQDIEERLAALPGLEETLERFRAAGLEERLRERSILVREEQVLQSIPERLQPFKESLESIRTELPVDRTFLSQKALGDLPGKEILMSADEVLEQLSRDLEDVVIRFQNALQRTDEKISQIRNRWDNRKIEVQAEYEKILRELKKSAIDGEEFIRLRRNIEGLRPLRERQKQLQQQQNDLLERRRMYLTEWEDLKAEEFRYLDRAAKKVNRKLRPRVDVTVTFSGNRNPLFELLRDRVGGQLSETIEKLRDKETISLTDFADTCREGAEQLREKYGFTPMQARNIAEAKSEVFMCIEELDLPPTTIIRLNTALAGEPPEWQTLEELSTGQKATAVLLLLLLDSDAPLIVDQPEDDLDNRFITEGVVPRIRAEKRFRQFVFSTHNANIPVLGDAELILGLSASGEADGGTTNIPRKHTGSIDEQPVRELVEDVLEGGKMAFETRRLKYGF